MAEPVRADRPGDQPGDRVALTLAIAKRLISDMNLPPEDWNAAARAAGVVTSTLLAPLLDEAERHLREKMAAFEELASARSQVVELRKWLDDLVPRMVEVAIFARDGNWSDSTIRDQVRKRLKLGQHAESEHVHTWRRCANCPSGEDEPCACAGAPCCDAERAEDQPVAARVWQKAEPEPVDKRLIVRDSQGDEWGRVREGWMLLTLEGEQLGPTERGVGPHPWSQPMKFAPLTEVLEGGDSGDA